MKSSLVGVAIAAWSITASAAQWFPLPAAKGIQVEIDLRSIVPAGGGMIKAWTSHSFDENKVAKGYPVIYYRSTAQLELFDCTQRTSDTLQEVLYSEPSRSGEVVQSRTFVRKDLAFSDVVPGSIGEGSLDFACEWIKSKKKK